MISSWAFAFDYTKIAREGEVHDEDGRTITGTRTSLCIVVHSLQAIFGAVSTFFFLVFKLLSSKYCFHLLFWLSKPLINDSCDQGGTSQPHLPFSEVVLNQGPLCPSENIQGCLEKILVVTWVEGECGWYPVGRSHRYCSISYKARDSTPTRQGHWWRSCGALCSVTGRQCTEMVKSVNFRARHSWPKILALPFTGSDVTGKLFFLSVPQFSYL